MKNSKIVSMILSLIVTALFLLTALGATVNAQTTNAATTQSFSFPYSYGTPQVPSDVGAQGVQGPTVPLSQLGPQGKIGAQGHIGPVNSDAPTPWLNTTFAFTFHVYNGTIASHTYAVNTLVTVTNVTWQWSVSATTNATGVVTLLITNGYYSINIKNTSTHIGFVKVDQLFSSSKPSQNIYLMPISSTVATINNGGTQQIYYEVEFPQIPSLNVSLYNQSSGKYISYAFTAYNGTVGFTGLSSSYQYQINVNGSINSETGMSYGLSSGQLSGTIATGTSGIQGGEYLSGITTSTSTVTGTALPTISPENGEWTLSSNTTLSGGTTILSEQLQTASYRLNLVNTILLLNYSFANVHNLNITSHNSTIDAVSETGADIFYTLSLFNSTVYATDSNSQTIDDFNIHSSYLLGGINIGYNGTISNSIIDKVYGGVVSSGPAAAFQHKSEIRNTTIENSYYFYMPGSWQNLVFSNDTIKNISIVNTQSPTDAVWFNNTFINMSNSGTSEMLLAFQQHSAQHVFFNNDNLTFMPVLTNIADYIELSNDTCNFTKTIFYKPGIFPTVFIQPLSLGPSNTLGNITLGIYDSYINENYSNSNVLHSYKNMTTTGGYQAGIYFPFSNFAVNYTTFVAVETYFIPSGSVPYTFHSYLCHDSFPYMRFDLRGSTIYQMMTHIGTQGSKEIDIISNDSFAYYKYNDSMMQLVTPHSYPGVGQIIEDMNIPTPADTTPNYLNVTHDTFYAVPVGNGTYSPGTAPVDILLGENDVISHVSNNLFKNNYAYDVGHSRTLISPVAWNIVPWAGTNYINNNWFMNLNSQIIPIGSNNNESSTQGWGGQNYLSNNHFFYSPAPGQNHVDAYYTTSHEAVNNIGTINYEIPANPGNFTGKTIKYIYEGGGTYISNTSVRQNMTGSLWYKYGPYVKAANGTEAIPDNYIWTVTPDVTNVSGTPTISYANGLVGGPQPNFTWQGYKYTESVEPSYISVGANSTKAPPVDLQFNGQPNTEYAVAMYEHGSLIDYTNVTSNANGVVTFQYNPATMPLDPVFELTTFTPIQPPPNGSPISTWNIILIGIAVIIVIGVVIPLVLREK